MRFLLLLTLLATWPAAGLEELWRHDIGCGKPHLPVVMNFDGETHRCVYVSSRLSNTIEVISAQGNLLATFRRPRRVAAGIACNTVLDQLLFEEAGGQLVLLNRLRTENFIADTDGAPAANQALAFADLNADGLPEVLRSNSHGTVTAYDRRMLPLWQYHAGQPISGRIAAAPVFEGHGGVYIACDDGTIHAVAGDGRPLWRRELNAPAFKPSNYRRPLVVQIPGGAMVLITDSAGKIYALDAKNGKILWQAQAGRGDAGVPAIVDRGPNGLRIVVVSEQGMTTTLDEQGNVVARGMLPEGRYVPAPLAADIDGDGQIEMLIASMDQRLIAASLDGRVKKSLKLPGNAQIGMILADIDKDRKLELIVATDCGHVICYKTKATQGWTHPAANPAMNGWVKRQERTAPMPLPPYKQARRSVRIESVTVRDFVERSPYGAAFVRARLARNTKTVSAIVRRKGSIVGSTLKPVEKGGFYLPLVQTSNEPLTLDLVLFNSEGKPLASSSNVAIMPGPLRLVRLNPVDDFLEALGARAEAFDVPAAWNPPTIGGRDYWDLSDTAPAQSAPYGPAGGANAHGNAVWEGVAQGSYCTVGGTELHAPMRFAFLRGASRQDGGKPWGVCICAGICAQNSHRPPTAEWKQRIGLPPQLGLRLHTAAYLSGATFIDRQSCLSEPATEYTGQRGAVYTPLAFMLDASGGWRPGRLKTTARPPQQAELSAEALMKHVYGWQELEDLDIDHLSSGPYGDIFDIIVSEPDAKTLEKYPVIWPLIDKPLDGNQVRELAAYVENGGILVADARLANDMRRRLPGIRFTGEKAVGTQIQTALAATAPVKAPYRYHVIDPGNARALAWTDAGHPLVVWKPMGKGMLIITASEGWTDETGKLLPVGEALMATLADAFVPINIPHNMEVIMNKTQEGWLVGIINNTPPLRQDDGTATPYDAEIAQCIIRFKRGAMLRFTPQVGNFQWNNRAAGLATSLKPGDIAIVAVTIKE